MLAQQGSGWGVRGGSLWFCGETCQPVRDTHRSLRLRDLVSPTLELTDTVDLKAWLKRTVGACLHCRISSRVAPSLSPVHSENPLNSSVAGLVTQIGWPVSSSPANNHTVPVPDCCMAALAHARLGAELTQVSINLK